MKNLWKLFKVIGIGLFMINAAVLSAQVRVVCIGNSITAGYGLANSSYEAYPAQLGALLGTGFNVHNLGVSGTTMAKRSEVSYWDTGRLTDAVNLDPQVVIILLGTNDADPSRWSLYKDQYYKDYLAMIAEFRKNGKNPIIFTGLCSPKFTASPQSDIIKNEVIPLIRQVSESQGTYVIDFYDNLLTAGRNFPDGVHPNVTGAGLMAEIAYKAIKDVNLIAPHISVNGKDKGTTEVSVNAEDNVILDPLPVSPALTTAGNWSWTGPNGFSATSRQVTLNDISANNGGFYVATYTNPAGLKSVQCFIVSVVGCTANAIVPYINMNSTWSQSTDISINAGESLRFGPQPFDGSWSWTGPNGFSLANRQFDLNNIKIKHAGDYVATYTSPSGCKTTVTFHVNVTVPDGCVQKPIVPYLHYNDEWLNVSSASLDSGTTLTFGPQPDDDGTWEWSGPNNFTSTDRQFTLTDITKSMAGIYSATYTTALGCKSVMDFSVTVDGFDGSLGLDDIDVEDPEMSLYPNPNNGILNVELQGKEYHSLNIRTVTGRVVYSIKLKGKSSLKIDVGDLLKAGIYVISVKSNNAMETKKLIVK